MVLILNVDDFNNDIDDDEFIDDIFEKENYKNQQNNHEIMSYDQEELGDLLSDELEPEKNVKFSIDIKVKKKEFTEINLFVKFPQSTRKQHIVFVSSNFSDLVKSSESFSAVYKFSLHPALFSNSRLKLETIVNIDSFKSKFPIPKIKFPIKYETLYKKKYIENFLIHKDSFLQPDENSTFIAKSLVKNVSDMWEAVNKIINWVNNDLFYDYRQRKGIKPLQEILFSHRGSCTEFVHLSLILLRINKIPCRAVQGLKRVNKRWVTHSWIEIYDPQYLWIPIDPTPKPPIYSNFDENYIQLFTSEDCLAPYYVVSAKGEKLKKTDFKIDIQITLDSQNIQLKKI